MILLAAVALTGALALPAAAATPSPSVVVTSRDVPVGGVLLVTGAHWPAGRGVELLIGPPRSEASHVIWTRADAAGRISARVRVPSYLRSGRGVVLACRRACRIKAASWFRLVPAIPRFTG
ncbi:unannotated protein [freshwater metagenome]|uniref:Unannotated protein n=1 Tax=freshwater metagenome TaxID=449393 RepID=A0A6J7H4J2_9ZZZZ